MPWNNSGMASGAASGASAGASFGPWGAVIGGVAGAAMGGMNGGAEKMDAPQLPATRYPGAVSSPYGSMVYDPVTGSTRYIQNTNQSAYNPSSYQDASLYDALMGGNSASSGLTQQMQQQQLMLDQLKAKGGGKMPTLAEFNLRAGADGKPLMASDYINKGGVNPLTGQSNGENPYWEDFMKQTGGQFGGTSGDIAFAKWAREVDKNSAGDLQSYQNALKAYESNTGAANDAIAQQELQIAQMKALAGDPGSAAAGVSQNPLMMALQQQEAEANSPYYLKSMNAQTQNTYDNQLQAQDQALAARGLGASGLGEMTRARMGLQLGNQFNQNALAANQMTTDKRQAALNNRMNMLNFLSGRKDAAFSQGMQKEGLGMQQVGMGMGYGMQNINNATQRDIAQTGLNSQYNLANMNNQAAQNMSNQRNWASALGGLGTYVSGMNSGNAQSGYESFLNSGGAQRAPLSSDQDAQGGTFNGQWIK